MLKHFTDDTGREDRHVVGRVGFIPFFECRGYIGFFPDGWEFSSVKGSLTDQLEDGSKFFIQSLKNNRFKFIWARSFMGI